MRIIAVFNEEENKKELVKLLRPYGPFVVCYSSLFTEAIASLCLAFGLDPQILKGLGQTSQEETMAAFRQIISQHKNKETILVVSDRSSLAGVVAWVEDIQEEAAIKGIVHNKEFCKKRLLVFEVDEEGKVW